ncbi:MAG: hypothetical protein KDD10_29175 [Phaeodactylibacter sp.]|nr:hypothetical protein [Phaeodactylibacter sp.]MCB9298290.1 hypothetical protein [Lewinellaceae bacterium]
MRILTLTLDIPLHPGDIPAFRSCIAGIAGLEHEIFHNHDNAVEGAGCRHWGYPLVQYAVRRGQAAVVGLGAGADAIQQVLVPKLPGQLQFAGRSHWLTGLQMNEQRHRWELLETPQEYGLFGWVALNPPNYAAWKAAGEPSGRKAVLERALTGQLRVLAKAAGFTALAPIQGEIAQVDNQKRVAWHGTHLVRFHALIRSALSLPMGIGIGRSAAFGYGETMPAEVYQSIMSRFPKSAALEL